MGSQLAAIKDDAPKEQALAQVQSYLAPAEGLRKKINKIRARIPLETL